MKSWSWLGSSKHVRAGRGSVANPLLNPKSIVRLQTAIEGRSVGIVTATLATHDAKENKRRDLALRTDAREAGLTHVRFYAVRTANGHLVERSLIAFGDKGGDSGLLEAALTKLARRNGQACFIFKPFDSRDAFIYEPDVFGSPAKIGNAIRVGPWHLDRLPEFHSMVMNGKMTMVPDYSFFKMLGEWSFAHRGRPGSEGPEFV